MADQLAGRSERVELLLPSDRSHLISNLHEYGQVLSTAYEDEGTRVQAVIPLKLLSQYAPFSGGPVYPLSSRSPSRRQRPYQKSDAQGRDEREHLSEAKEKSQAAQAEITTETV